MEDRHALPDPILPVLALSIAALVACGSPAAAQISQEEAAATARRLTVEDVVNFHSLVSQSPPALSPGAGSFAAYTMEGPRRTVGRIEALLRPSGDSWTELRVADTSTGDVTGLGRRSWGGSWSPDGTRLAYLAAEREAIRLGIWEAGRPEPAPTYPDAALWATWIATVPEWTPDGRRLVVKVLPAGIETREMLRRARPGLVGGASDSTDAPADIGHGQPTVTILRSDEVETPRSDPPSDEPVGADPRGESREAAASPELPEWLRWQYGGDLALLDAETGRIDRLTRGRLPMSWKISPGGRHVALLEMTGIDGGDAHLALTVVSLDGGATVELPGAVVQTWGRGLSWSPDGSRIAYLSGGQESGSGVFVADPAAGTRRRIAALKPGWDVEAPPVWSSSGEALLLAGTDTVWSVAAPAVAAGPEARSPHEAPTALVTFSRHRIGDLIAPRSALSPRPTADGTLLLRVATRDTGDPGFALIDVERGRVLSVHTEPGSYGGSVRTDLASEGSSALALYSTTREAPELWRLGPGLERRRRVSSLNPGFDPASLGEDRLVRWTTGDGERLEGTLLLPPGLRDGEAAPLIVQVYGGGSGAAALDSFDRHRQLLASNGYAVLVPDVPLRVGTPMADHARAVLPGIDRLIEMGIADPRRIGVTGHSYGGYGTLALLVQSDRFAAAVASAAQADLVANYGRVTADGSSRTRWSEQGQGRMGATLWEAPERYRENSPIMLLDRVTAPLLLLHGSDDPTVPVWLAEGIFSGLRRLDRPVTLARYAGEGHWSGDWSVPNQVDYWSRLLGWFDRYMRPG